MKVIIAVLCFCAAITLSKAQYVANANDYMDYVFKGVTDWFMSTGVIPMELPDVVEQIEFRPILITYRGELILTNGELTSLESIDRHGDSYFTYDRQLLRIKVGASLNEMRFRYDYDASIMDLGPSGWAEGSASYMAMDTDFLIDTKDFYIYLQNFKVTSLGQVRIVLRGNILIDWLNTLLVNTVTIIFKRQITEVVSRNIEQMIESMLDDINNRNRFEDRKLGVERLMKFVGQPIDFN